MNLTEDRMSDILIRAIGALLDDAARSSFTGVIQYTLRGETSQIVFTADGVTGEWDYRYTGRARRMTRDRLGGVTERSGPRIVDVQERPDRIPFELRIAFPIALPVWDRRDDEWRMVSATENAQVITINLVHRERPDLQATLTVDMERRLAMTFTTPVDSVSLVPVADPTPPGAFAAYEAVSPESIV
jgi:hypothetical protein